MATLSEWFRGWREIADQLGEGGREAITMRHDGSTYEVLAVSTYEPGAENGLIVAKTASRDFDSKVALFSRRTRDTGLARVITNKGRPRFLLQPGDDAIAWASAVEGLSPPELRTATRQSARGWARRARHENWTIERVQAACDSVDSQVIEIEEDLEDLRSEAEALLRVKKRLSLPDAE